MTSHKYLLVLFGIQLFLFDTLYAQRSKKFFRKDYKFIEASQSFYKIHTLHKTWEEARDRCELEGAKLFYAEDSAEVDAVLDYWTEKQPHFQWVFVGISDLVAKEVFETIDGRPIADVYDAWGPGEPNNANNAEDCVILRRDKTLNDDNCGNKYPFICKKSLDDLEWNDACDIPNMDYTYNSDQGKCYKFHLDPQTWTDAAAACSAEQSYLAVINSQSEADYLTNITAQAPKDKVEGNFMRGAVHLGFHNRDGRGWKTVKGTSLADSGYSRWGNQQPDGGSVEKCGTMFYNGQLNDLECIHKCFFICEHDIGILNDSFDERFGED